VQQGPAGPGPGGPKPKIFGMPKMMFFAIIGVVIAVVVVLAVVMIMGGGAGAKSPSGAAKGFLNSAMEKDVEGMLDNSILALQDSAYDKAKADFEKQAAGSSGTGSLSIDSTETKYQDEMSASQKEEGKEKADWLAKKLNVVVDDFAWVKVSGTYTNSEGVKTPGSETVLTVKVDGKWYVYEFEEYLNSASADGGTEDGTPSVTFHADADRTQIGIEVSENVKLSDIKMIIKDSNGDEVEVTLKNGAEAKVNDYKVSFTDGDDDGEISKNDSFWKDGETSGCKLTLIYTPTGGTMGSETF